MTTIRVPALKNGAGVTLDSVVSAVLIDESGNQIIGFGPAYLATENLSASSDTVAVDLELLPQSQIALPPDANGDPVPTWYSIVVSSRNAEARYLVQVPVSSLVVDLETLIGAAAIDPSDLPAQIVSNTLEAAAAALASASDAEGFVQAASGSADDAEGSASAASTSAGLAAGSALSAAGSASAASGSASDAAGSAGDADQSAADIAGLSATVDGTGHLILEIGTQDPIDAGHVVGADGADGVDGTDGHSPVLTWVVDQIAIDGTATGPHLTGPAGADGTDGTDGDPGPGVPTGGTTSQVLAKKSDTPFDTEWVDQTGGSSNLALGETSTTAYRGDRGATAYAHSQAAHAPVDATAAGAVGDAHAATPHAPANATAAGATGDAFATSHLSAFDHADIAHGETAYGWGDHASAGYAAASALHSAVTLDTAADTILSLSGQAIGLDTQTAATVLAGPATGSPATPTMRALVATDIPALSYAATSHAHSAASTSAAGFEPQATAPSAGLRSVLAIDNGETARSDKALFDASNPAALGAAGPGSAMVAARRDHIHTMPSAADVGAVPIDADGIATAKNFVGYMTITVTSGQTITLTRASRRRQMFTGTESVTVILPIVSTLELGFPFFFDSDTTGTVNVKSSGENTVVTLATDQWAEVSCRAITGTSATSWDVHRPEPAQTLVTQAYAEDTATPGTTVWSWSVLRMMQAGAAKVTAMLASGIAPYLTGYSMAGTTSLSATGSPLTLTAPMNGATRVGYTLSANLKIDVSSVPTAPTDATVTFFIRQAASGGPYTLSYPSGWYWPGGIVPAMPTTASAVMKVRVSTTPFGTIEAGGTWIIQV